MTCNGLMPPLSVCCFTWAAVCGAATSWSSPPSGPRRSRCGAVKNDILCKSSLQSSGVSTATSLWNWIKLRTAAGLVDALLDTEPNRLSESFRNALFQRTSGHPLFTIELLRAMQEREEVLQDESGRWVAGPALDWQSLPARVEGVIEEHLGRLDEEQRDILGVACVEGERFTAQVIARILELDEHLLLRNLSREFAGRQRLVRWLGGLQVGEHRLLRYRFAHALFRQYLYARIGPGERQLLHREIAAILEELYQGRTR